MSDSLWGDIESLPTVNTPRVILSEQAGHLTNSTKGLLVGEIQSYAMDEHSNETEITFDIYARSLNNYRVRILDCRFGKYYYPATVYIEDDNTWQEVADESAFKKLLAEILKSARVRNIVGGLLSELRSMGFEPKDEKEDIPF